MYECMSGVISIDILGQTHTPHNTHTHAHTLVYTYTTYITHTHTHTNL